MVTKVIKYRYGYNGNDQSFTEPYLVTVDSINDSILTVIYAAGIPALLSFHPDNGNYKVMDGGISAERIENKGTQWKVNVTYSKIGYSFDTGGGDPTDRLMSFTVDSVVYMKTAEGAYESRLLIPSDGTANAGDLQVSYTDGDLKQGPKKRPDLPLINSAGEALDFSSTQDEYFNKLLRFTIREHDKFDYVGISDLQGFMNKDTTNILGFPLTKKQGLARKITPEMVIDQYGKQSWICHYEIEIARPGKTMELEILDAGFKQNIAEAGTPKLEYITIADFNDSVVKNSDEDVQLSEPLALDGTGKLLDSELAATGCFYWRYRTKPWVEWEKEFDFIREKIRVR